MKMSKINAFLAVCMSFAHIGSWGSDVASFKKECVDLGFKINTLENSNCALKLLKRDRALEEKNFELQERQSVNAMREAEINRQQQQMYELQQRSVAAQEKAAKAQDRAATNQIFNTTSQMLMGTGSFYKPPAVAPRAPITCTTTGPFTNCQ